jgi:hypothetical protein
MQLLRQVEALASLQSAIQSQEENLIETVEFVAKEAGDVRERITKAYRYHLRIHRGASSGSAA